MSAASRACACVSATTNATRSPTKRTFSACSTCWKMRCPFGAPKGHRIFQQVLQAEKVRFVGDRVAFVVAETQAQARDAADMIDVDYDTLPAVALVEDAAKDGAPKVW